MALKRVYITGRMPETIKEKRTNLAEEIRKELTAEFNNLKIICG